LRDGKPDIKKPLDCGFFELVNNTFKGVTFIFWGYIWGYFLNLKFNNTAITMPSENNQNDV
jgi:hypothetical protein